MLTTRGSVRSATATRDDPSRTTASQQQSTARYADSLIQPLGTATEPLFLKTRGKPNASAVGGTAIYYPWTDGAMAGRWFALGGASATSAPLYSVAFKSHALRNRGGLVSVADVSLRL